MFLCGHQSFRTFVSECSVSDSSKLTNETASLARQGQACLNNRYCLANIEFILMRVSTHLFWDGAITRCTFPSISTKGFLKEKFFNKTLWHLFYFLVKIFLEGHIILQKHNNGRNIITSKFCVALFWYIIQLRDRNKISWTGTKPG